MISLDKDEHRLVMIMTKPLSRRLQRNGSRFDFLRYITRMLRLGNGGREHARVGQSGRGMDNPARSDLQKRGIDDVADAQHIDMDRLMHIEGHFFTAVQAFNKWVWSLKSLSNVFVRLRWLYTRIRSPVLKDPAPEKVFTLDRGETR